MNAQFSVGQRVKVVRRKIVGRRPVVDEETGQVIQRAVMRKAGKDIGTVTKVQDAEFYTVQFDMPVPDVNDPRRSQLVWSVYFRDMEAA